MRRATRAAGHGSSIPPRLQSQESDMGPFPKQGPNHRPPTKSRSQRDRNPLARPGSRGRPGAHPCRGNFAKARMTCQVRLQYPEFACRARILGARVLSFQIPRRLEPEARPRFRSAGLGGLAKAGGDPAALQALAAGRRGHRGVDDHRRELQTRRMSHSIAFRLAMRDASGKAS